ncbi:PurA Adenylosuccinate synthase [uncultured Caudovirales phage]|uniref:PurA Adenylosuccinate synthase n=1 Tax=uncultured Caudovirales phage TaxID=2100421 RepID=A0A6J5NRX9_9CAUD|nr:PurA Adenylosuccinate synthase [uncultured Caudovirales phage]
MITSITGSQFGDEGKGKITDYLSANTDYVVRWSGGANAGHTIQVDNQQYKLKLIPSGVFQNKKVIITGNCIVDPISLEQELNYLAQYDIIPEIYLDTNCVLSLPIHKTVDFNNDKLLNIGTTKSGIGPTVSDFVNRIAIKVTDVVFGTHDEKLKTLIKFHTDYLEEVYEENLKALEILNELPVAFCSRKEIVARLNRAENIIFEGAQGTMLDINHGTYPYCTSTPCISSAIPYVIGIGNLKIDRNIGVFKPYVTRVGNGGFETEILQGKVKEHLQLVGKEVGTNTGRTRRVGWLDLHDLKYACELNNFTELAVTKLDVLTGLESVGVLDKNKNWWSFNGWQTDITDCKTYESLPPAAYELLDFIEKQLELKISIVSVGPDRKQTIERSL